MTTDEIRALPYWPKIKQSIEMAMEDCRPDDPLCKVELVDRGSMFVIVVDGEDEIEIDALTIQ